MSRSRRWTRLLAFAALVLAADPARADWQRLDAEALVAALSGTQVDYDGAAWQMFLPDGRTFYRVGETPAGTTSLGDWRVQGDSYCTRWQPGGEWECYWVEIDGAGGVRFVDGFGNVSAGRFVTEAE